MMGGALTVSEQAVILFAVLVAFAVIAGFEVLCIRRTWRNTRTINAQTLALLAEWNKRMFPLSDWREEDGPVLWFRLPVDEPVWIGTPLDEDWPGYHTHWTPHPAAPETTA